MRQALQWVFFAVLSVAPAHAGAAPMSAYMDCARAIGVAINDKLAVIPGRRFGDKGLFVYTERSAFFLPLGAPLIDDGEANEFFLRTSISAVGDIFLVYRDRSPGGSANIQPAIGLHTQAPMKEAVHAYRFTPASDAFGEVATDAMRRKLMEKTATVAGFLNEKHRFSTPAEAKAGFEADRRTYRAKLERCRIAGDRGLGVVVAEEIQKLEAGFTGVTIWEKQVGGRAPLDQAR